MTTQTERSEDVLYRLGFDDGLAEGRKSSRHWQVELWRLRYESCHHCLCAVSVFATIATIAALWGWLR